MSVSAGVFPGNPTASLNTHTDQPFAVVEISPDPGRATVLIRTVAEADALIRAFVAAKDLLAAGGVS